MEQAKAVCAAVAICCLGGAAVGYGAPQAASRQVSARQQVPAERLRATVADLSSTDPARRGAALIALRDVHDPAVVPMLTQALVSAQPPAQDTIIEALSLFPDPRKVPALIAAARDFSAVRADAIARQFTGLGAIAARALLDAVGDCTRRNESKTYAFHEWAAKTVGLVGEAAIPVLRAAARSQVPCRRWAAMLALGTYAWNNEACRWDPQCEAQRLLARGARDPSGTVRRAAASQIEMLREPETRDAEEPIKPLSAARRRALMSKDPVVRLKALEAIAGNGESAGHDAVIALLKDPDDRVRAAAASALEDLDHRDDRTVHRWTAPGAETARPALIAVLADNNANVRAAAARALGAICGVQTLDDTRPRPEIDALLHTLGDPAAGVRQAAARALGDLQARAAVQPLLTMLSTPGESAIRATAAAALGDIRDPRAGAALGRTLGDSDRDVRAAAARALSSIYGSATDSPAADPSLIAQMIAALADEATRDWMVAPLGRAKDPRAIPPLIANLDKPSMALWCAICSALAEIGDSSAVEPLLPFLQSRERTTREGVARALGVLKDARAVRALSAALKDAQPDVRAAAAESLGKIGDKSAIVPLTEAATDEAPAVREAIEQALRQLGAQVPKR